LSVVVLRQPLPKHIRMFHGVRGCYSEPRKAQRHRGVSDELDEGDRIHKLSLPPPRGWSEGQSLPSGSGLPLGAVVV
jgi:hypothetical protein